MSNPEMARFLEKEHLRDAEDSDYQLMEDLIQRRLKSSKERNMLTSSNTETERYQGKLRRESAFEADLPTPHVSVSNTPAAQSPVDPSTSQIFPTRTDSTFSIDSTFSAKKLFKNVQKEVQL
nr:uncharacterized protein LOC106691364 [Halyomorpha halys]